MAKVQQPLDVNGRSEKSGEALRKAGRLEQFFNTRSRINLNSYVAVTARYASVVGASLDKTVLFAALEDVIQKHVALATRLPPLSSGSPWVRLSSVNLNKVVTFVQKDSTDLHILLEEVFAKPLDFSQDMPLWRLLALRDGTVVFAFDHTLGDGQSGLAFHHALLASLNRLQDPVSGHSGMITMLPEHTALTPALEDALDVSVPFPMLARELLKLIFPFLKRELVHAWTGHPVVASITLDSAVRILHYSPEEIAMLAQLSRDHKTTLTGTLHTLALIVVSRLIYAQPGNDEKFKTIPTCIPISMRRYTGVPRTEFCNHISPYVDYHPLFPQSPAISPDTFPWDNAAALTGALRREAPRSAPGVGLLKYLNGKYDKYLLGQLGKTRQWGLEFSNLGAFPALDDGSEVGPWRVHETLFAHAVATNGAALKLNAVGTPDGGVGVTVTWGKGAVDDEFAEEFVKGFEQGMKAMVG